MIKRTIAASLLIVALAGCAGAPAENEHPNKGLTEQQWTQQNPPSEVATRGLSEGH